MTVEERIRKCLILEAMKENREAARELGLKDVSKVIHSSKQLKAGGEKGR